MGKRGPKAGAKYEKRVYVARSLPVISDCQLLAAQNFNERLDGVLAAFDRRVYPAGALEPTVTRRFVDAAELLQSAIIGGIEEYETRGVSSSPSHPASGVRPNASGEDETDSEDEEEGDEEIYDEDYQDDM